MGFSIHPLVEADLPTFVRIELEAFRSHPRIPMLWPGGYTPDLYAFYELSKTKAFRDPDARFVKAVDDKTGEIVGCCQMTLTLDVESNNRQNAMDPDEPPPPNWPVGGNWEMRRWYTINAHRMLMESFGGKKYMLVNFLVVDPDFQGQGIGNKLLTVAVKEADERNFPLGLESTPSGLALYKKHGFREVQTVKADMKQFGWMDPYDEDSVKRVWMVREPGGRE